MEENWIKCDECLYLVHTTEQLKEHIMLNHMVSKRFFHCHYDHYQKTHNCESCEKVFKREEHLLRHVKAVHGPNKVKFSCPDCGKEFSREDALVRHKKDGSGRISCDSCNETFCTGKLLKEHYNELHVGLSCEFCQAQF